MSHLSALMSGMFSASRFSFVSPLYFGRSPSRDSLMPSRMAFLSTRYETHIVRISAISSTAASKSTARVIAVSSSVMLSFLLLFMLARARTLPAALRAGQWGVLSLRPGTSAATLKG